MRVGITGVAGYLGKKIVHRLCRNDQCDHMVGIDVCPWRHDYEKLDYIQMDVRSSDLFSLFASHEVDTVLHLAFVLNPTRNEAEMHEINVEGARNVLQAAAAAGATKCVISSSAMVYGAWPDNLPRLTEDSLLRGHPKYYYVKDKVEVEHVCEEWTAEHHDMHVTVIRPCLVMGPHVTHFYSQLVEWPVLPLIDGANPEMQFIHEDDVARAFEYFVTHDFEGVYNVVGKDTMCWRDIIEAVGVRFISVPAFIIYPFISLLWKLHLTKVPPPILDFIRYQWVVSGEKAKKAGFTPQYSTKTTLSAFKKTR